MTFSENNKVLITGGLGFIGKNLTSYLLENTNCSIVIVDNNSINTLNSLQDYFNDEKRISYFIDDLKYPQMLEDALKGIDIVFHLAANSDISKGVNNPQIDFLNTTTATFNLLSAMKSVGVKNIVFSSGSGIYGMNNDNIFDESYAPLFPVSHYGASKLCAEAMISSFVHMHDMQAFIFRFANVVGDWQSHGVAYDLIKRLKKDPEKLNVLGNGYQNKSYIHVSDVLNAIFCALEYEVNEPVQAFNVSNDDSITVREIVKIILSEMDLPSAKIEYGTTPYGWMGDVPEIKLKNDKIKALGWNFKYNSEQAVKKAVEFLISTKVPHCF
jgi:UDP-glucose 4-epimerase